MDASSMKKNLPSVKGDLLKSYKLFSLKYYVSVCREIFRDGGVFNYVFVLREHERNTEGIKQTHMISTEIVHDICRWACKQWTHAL